jgi:hypothetical protein
MYVSRTGLAAVVAATISLPASAQELLAPGAERFQNGYWYIGTGYRFQTLKLPRIDNAMRALPSANALVSLRPEFSAHGMSGYVGHAFQQGSYPVWAGENLRVELIGWWVTTNHRAAGGETGDITSISLLRIDGINSGLAGLHLDTQSTIRAVSQQWQIALRLATDYPLAPQWIFSPEIAVLGGLQNDDYKLFERGQQTNLFQDRRAYDVNTTRIGGHVGGRLTFKLVEWFAVHVAGYAGAVHTEASLRAFEELNTGIAVTNVSVSTSRTALAFITGGQAGFTVSTGYVILVVSGGVDYNSRVAGVRVPTFADPGSIGIKFTRELNYNVMATVKVRLF